MKKAFITAIVTMTLIGTQVQASTEEAGRAVASTVAGAVAGYGAVVVAPVTALGCIGASAGFGTAIGPVGTVIGAIAGLAGYGVYRLTTSNDKKGN